jgi:hypothetical protein
LFSCCKTQQETLDNEQDDDSVVHSQGFVVCCLNRENLSEAKRNKSIVLKNLQNQNSILTNLISCYQALICFSDSKERSCSRWCLFGTLRISILVLLLVIPTLYRPTLLRFDHINRSNISLVINNFKQMVTQCKRNPIIQWIVIGFSLLAFTIASLILLIKQENGCGGFFHGLCGTNIFHS